MLELGGALIDHLADARAEQRRIDLRTKLHQQADQIAQHVLDGGEDVQSWSAAVDTVRRTLSAARQQADAAAQAEVRRQEVTDALSSIKKALTAPPSKPCT